ncbi:MAG: helix-turn-helix domain-containing protein [Alphaproteobacteria bacterium]
MSKTTDDGRIAAGQWLRKARLQIGKTQQEVARLVGFEYYSMITGIEAGRARVPSSRYADYARALGMDPKDFAREMIRYYDPDTWKILFSGNNVSHLRRERCSQ